MNANMDTTGPTMSTANRTGGPLMMAGPSGPPDYVFALAYEVFIVVGVVIIFLFSLPQTLSFLRSERIKQGWWLSHSETALPRDSIQITRYESQTSDGEIKYKPPKIHTVTFPTAALRDTERLRVLLGSGPDLEQPYAKGNTVLAVAPRRGQGVIGARVDWMAAKMSKFIGGPISMNLGPWLMVFVINIVANMLFSLGPPFFVAPDRPAHIAIAQIPILFILATKNNILSYMLGKSYEKINFVHRTVGRLVTICATLHVVGQFIKYSQHGALGQLMSIPWVQAGLAAWIGLIIVTLGSIGPIRIKLYDVFLSSHVIGNLVFMIALHFHMPVVVTPYTLTGLSFYLADLILRSCKMRLRPATITALDDEMTLIAIQGIDNGWRAGQHVWLRILQGNRSYESHPFTIANAPSSPSGSGLLLYARAAGDFTRSLNVDTRLQPNSSMKVDVVVDGPYGGMMMTDLADYKNVLLVAGGAGASFVMSLWEDLVVQSMQRKACTEVVDLVWAVKDYAHLKWHMNAIERVSLAAASSAISLRVHLYVTNSQTPPKGSEFSTPSTTEVIFKRPDIPALVAEAVNYAALAGQSNNVGGGGMAIAACGPVLMIRDVQLATRRISVKDRRLAGGISLHTEVFGL